MAMAAAGLILDENSGKTRLSILGNVIPTVTAASAYNAGITQLGKSSGRCLEFMTAGFVPKELAGSIGSNRMSLRAP